MLLRPLGAMNGWRGGSGELSRRGVAGTPSKAGGGTVSGSFGIGSAAGAARR